MASSSLSQAQTMAFVVSPLSPSIPQATCLLGILRLRNA
jgi:hypothetical protein